MNAVLSSVIETAMIEAVAPAPEARARLRAPAAAEGDELAREVVRGLHPSVAGAPVTQE